MSAPPATTAPERSPARDARRTTAILWIICVSYFMVILDNSIIFTGLPRIQAAMQLSPSGLTWVQDAYTLVFGGLLLLGARAGDILGRRRMFIVGLLLFGLASFLVGAAPTDWWLIAARAVQGVGAAILAPSSLALLTASFPEGPQRARAVAAYAAVAGIGASLGLVVGGVLAEAISWRAGFFLNVPLGPAMVLAANFAVALGVNRIVRWVGPSTVLVLGVGITLAGMVWLSRVDAASSYLTAVALPMTLLGIGQGLAFAPMTSAGLAGVDGADAGAASGLVNTFHQLGCALGLAVLTAASLAAPAPAVLVDRVGAALSGGSALLAIAFALTVGLIARPRRPLASFRASRST